CWFCSTPIGSGNSTVTCLMPAARGGTTLPENLCAACVPCSTSKNGKTVDEYRHWVWQRSCTLAAVASQLEDILDGNSDLPAFYKAELGSLSARLALAAPPIRFFGEISGRTIL
ncbi:MAG: hypothetical protein ABIS27_11210, partial [Longimicrobiales bacterium]